MTDYLEEALEGIDALIKRMRRIRQPDRPPHADPVEDRDKNWNDEGDSAGIRREIKRAKEEKKVITRNMSTVDDTDFGINRMKNLVYDLDLSGMRLRAEEDGDKTADEGRQMPAEPEEILTARDKREEQEPIPLPTSRPAGLFFQTDGAGAVQTTESALERPAARPAGELSWAEQADRAFRRDSRRYDGGFYLY